VRSAQALDRAFELPRRYAQPHEVGPDACG